MLVEWVKQRLALCSRKIGAWHFRKVFKTYHSGRYCLRCWMNEMTYLPQSTRAWRIEHTGISGHEPDRSHEVRMEESARALSNGMLGLARAGDRIAAVLDCYLVPPVKGARRGKRR